MVGRKRTRRVWECGVWTPKPDQNRSSRGNPAPWKMISLEKSLHDPFATKYPNHRRQRDIRTIGQARRPFASPHDDERHADTRADDGTDQERKNHRVPAEKLPDVC